MIRILSIETSADETSVAILDVFESENEPEFVPHAHVISSQIDTHKQYGGIFPAIAKREHSKNIGPVFMEAIDKLQVTSDMSTVLDSELENKLSEILNREPEVFNFIKSNIGKIQNPNVTHIAVTIGPGLEPALWVGVSFAKALSELWGLPIIPVNHMEGHLMSILLSDCHPELDSGSSKNTSRFRVKPGMTTLEVKLPAIALLVSGGHTELILVKDWGQYEKIGQTVDDASGEAFDKVARMLDLPYPGGPQISKLADLCRSNVKGHMSHAFKFPRPMMHSKDFNFSFSGLKTAVLYHIRDNPIKSEEQKAEIACEFENAVVDVLVSKTKKAIEESGAETLIVAGGVSANKYLQTMLQTTCYKLHVPVFFPGKELTGDNALMIAIAGYFNLNKKNADLKADGNLSL
jgi:N6-L-threonylcarbamoyladenine synthase